VCAHAPFLNLHNHLGEVIQVQPLPEREYGSQAYNGHRGEMHQIIFNHAKSIGVDIRLGQNVTEYWEMGQDGLSGVIANGEYIYGDVVIGADGVRSKARELILVRLAGCTVSSR
jgi:flavin-dependent dehydrogenase